MAVLLGVFYAGYRLGIAKQCTTETFLPGILDEDALRHFLQLLTERFDRDRIRQVLGWLEDWVETLPN